MLSFVHHVNISPAPVLLSEAGSLSRALPLSRSTHTPPPSAITLSPAPHSASANPPLSPPSPFALAQCSSPAPLPFPPLPSHHHPDALLPLVLQILNLVLYRPL